MGAITRRHDHSSSSGGGGMSGMGGMGGMGGMAGTNMFQSTNIALAETYWYIIVGVLALMVAIRLVNYYDFRQRLRNRASTSTNSPTKPANGFLQAWATLTAVGREMSYPQLYVPARFFSWATPPPLGRILVLLIYWAVIIGMMTTNAIIKDGLFWERIGFRNAWVTVTQLPLLYLLASKSSVLSFISGISYERLNWMHRWVARTMFVTASVHGWHFWNEYAIAGLTQDLLEIMPMVYYGIAAWTLLLWSCISTFAPLRQWCYELFVIQHILTAVIFLWVIYVHIPSYARYNLWFAIAALCFDRFCRTFMLVWQNIKFRPNKARCKGGQRIGHQAQVSTIGDSTTAITIKDVHFRWRPGQHLYLWMPRVGPVEAHPYTIACAHQLPDTCICNSIQLIVRKHDGFSKRLHKFASETQGSEKKRTCTVFVHGPYGNPPRWDVYETLILISASTGTSFTLPILESVLQAKRAICTKRIDFLLAAKKGDEIDYYIERLHEAIGKARDLGIELRVHVAVTGTPSTRTRNRSPDSFSEKEGLRSQTIGATSSTCAMMESGKCCASSSVDIETSVDERSPKPRGGSSASVDSHVHHSSTRPDIRSFIRSAVEETGGETSVVVCGGKSLVAGARNCVAQLSDERAVHKGTGAQGIHLHVEEYCF
ncbi:uncharacterized protein E0L32_008631 [Thyridium curvatum]|uniref:ferric-chelate reductase (NADPH) n=1 Tax=Thyridium curvatum TaxID=1093900 RepID=A0A507AL55_9PEZI|nr:uncharacterized protein E0L32_008631 [Thyridium curvatum]TPX10412.1 hypothetical protein E0L32_008631 [Thyridium curvatum]